MSAPRGYQYRLELGDEIEAMRASIEAQAYGLVVWINRSDGLIWCRESKGRV